MAKPFGTVDLQRIVEMLNALPEATRREVLPVLREHDPDTRYYVQADGRVDAVAADDMDLSQNYGESAEDHSQRINDYILGKR